MAIVTYVNNQKGTRTLAQHTEVMETMPWVELSLLSLTAVHINGHMDWLSRQGEQLSDP